MDITLYNDPPAEVAGSATKFGQRIAAMVDDAGGDTATLEMSVSRFDHPKCKEAWLLLFMDANCDDLMTQLMDDGGNLVDIEAA